MIPDNNLFNYILPEQISRKNINLQYKIDIDIPQFTRNMQKF